MTLDTAPVHGRVDGDGRLVEADPPLAALHARAGGAEGGVIAVPQLAALVRLARRLGITISRGVIAADGERDLDLWVRAQPDGEGVQLAIVGWGERPAAPPFAASLLERERDFQRAGADWRWETGADFKLTALTPATDGLIDQPLTRLFAFREDDDGSFPILDALASRRRFEGQRAELRDDGRRLLLRGAPAFDEQGGFIGYRGTATSLDAARPIADAGEEGAGDPDAFGQRLDSALRGPLDRIIANADSISARAEGPIRADYANYAVDIASAGRHLLALVGDLVDLQAIEQPGFRVETAPFDLAESVRRAAALLGSRAAEQGVRIDRPSADEPLIAQGDGRRSLQILVNLIGNAVRYSPSGGAVWLRWEREDGIVAVIVADQGKGVAPEDQARIFEKFERVDPAEPGGTGLGLYIARRLARAMGGDIAIDSAAGQGARFIFTLPAV